MRSPVHVASGRPPNSSRPAHPRSRRGPRPRRGHTPPAKDKEDIADGGSGPPRPEPSAVVGANAQEQGVRDDSDTAGTKGHGAPVPRGRGKCRGSGCVTSCHGCHGVHDKLSRDGREEVPDSAVLSRMCYHLGCPEKCGRGGPVGVRKVGPGRELGSGRCDRGSDPPRPALLPRFAPRHRQRQIWPPPTPTTRDKLSRDPVGHVDNDPPVASDWANLD